MNETTQDSFQAIFVLIWPVLQQWMTNSGLAVFKWISPASSDKFKIALSGLAAFASTAGFHWNHSAYALLTGGQLMLTIPALPALGHTLGAWVMQHHIYNVAIKNPQLTQALLTQIGKLVSIQQAHLDEVLKKP